jgi:hypothetical protein
MQDANFDCSPCLDRFIFVCGYHEGYVGIIGINLVPALDYLDLDIG